jgi:hypothetical protein
MRLLSAYFDKDGSDGMYARCLKVWEYSAQQNSGAVAVDVIDIEQPKAPGGDQYLFAANHAKLKVWRDYVREHDDDVVLMDCDTMVLRDLTHVFKDYKFDVAVTTRDSNTRLTINGGVVFVRNTKAAERIMDLWYERDTELRADRKLHERFRSKYGGMNQSSYGYMISKNVPGTIIELPCSKYNQVEWWVSRKIKPCVVHIKSELRHAVFSKRDAHAIRYTMRDNVVAWRKMEKAAKEAELANSRC